MKWRGAGTSEASAHPGASAAIGIIVAAGLAITGWRFIGPDHLVYAFVVQGGFTFLGLLTGPLFVDTARRRYTVASAEPRIYALLGADALRRLLGRIGWNSVIANLREQGEGHTRHHGLLRDTELSETGHTIAGAVTLLLAAAAIGTAHFVGATQIILVGLLLHGYPIMIQRIVRQRLRLPRNHDRRLRQPHQSAEQRSAPLSDSTTGDPAPRSQLDPDRTTRRVRARPR